MNSGISRGDVTFSSGAFRGRYGEVDPEVDRKVFARCLFRARVYGKPFCPRIAVVAIGKRKHRGRVSEISI